MGVPDGYLSITDWPQHMPRGERVELLARAAGMAPYEAGQAARRTGPQVISVVDSGPALDTVRMMRQAGVDAHCPTVADLAAVTEAAPVARFGSVPGKAHLIGVEPLSRGGGGGRGDEPKAAPFAVSVGGAFMVIRATVTTRSTTVLEGDPSAAAGAVALGYMVGGVGGALAGAAMAAEGGAGGGRSTSVRLYDMVELQVLENGGGVRRLRCDLRRAPVTSQQDRLRSPAERADRAATKLAEMAPRARLDLRHPDFRIAGAALRTRWTDGPLRTADRNDEAATFEFYSRWLACVGRPGGV